MTKRQRARRRQVRKVLTVISMLMAVALVAITGTVAWLTDTSSEIKNTFTTTDIDIDLVETSKDKLFEMIPGNEIVKDPEVQVLPNSVASWVFVKVEESANLDAFITYEVLTGKTITGVEGTCWNALDTTKYPGVYYCKVNATDASTTVTIPVIGYRKADGTADGTVVENKVLVNNTVTKQMMNTLTDGTNETTDTRPTLTFKAYAIQQANFDTAADAWVEASK